MAEEAIAPKRKFTTIALVNGHGIKLPFEYFCLYSWISVALSFGQRSFCLQWVKAHNWSIC